MEDFVEVLRKLNASGVQAVEAGKEERKEKASRFIDEVEELYKGIEGNVIDTIKNMTVEGRWYGVVFEAQKEHVNFLSGRWVPWIARHYPERAVSIRTRLEEFIKKNCNGGIDPNTLLPYAVSILTKKSSGSIPMGVVLSRKGIRYDSRPAAAATNGGRPRGTGWVRGRGNGSGPSRGSRGGFPPVKVVNDDPTLGPPRSIPVYEE